MRPELLSTARPSRLRLAGFACVVVGTVLTGVGSILTWATVGFPGDVRQVLDVEYKGVDTWEGRVALAVAAATLIATVASRLATSGTLRRAIAIGVLLGGLATAGLAAADLARAETRFGGGGGLAEAARRLADRTGLPVEHVRTQLERNFGASLRVDAGPGLPATIAGGIVLAAAGGLTLAWAARAPAIAGPVAEGEDVSRPVAEGED